MLKPLTLFLLIGICNKNAIATDSEEPPEVNCGGPPTCPENEIYTNCVASVCRPLNCSQVGRPLSCPYIINCSVGGCVCKKGYARLECGTCVPVNECLASCGGDPNAVSGCGNHCGHSCDDYDKNPPCSKICRLNSCDCKTGYVFDKNTGKCVLPKDCTKVCTGQNEEFNLCPGSCPPRTCSSIGKKIFCPKQPIPGDKDCKPNCVCKQGFYRNIEGVCVSKDDCMKCNNTNEVYDSCAPTCPPEGCEAIGKIYHCPLQVLPGSLNCKGKCRCAKGYYRDCDDKCIPKKECPKCMKPNEEYQVCPPSCPGESCSVDPRLVKCAAPPKPGDKNCAPDGCRCKPGYCRNDDGDCVSRDDFDKCKIKNEIWVACPITCPPQTCQSIIGNNSYGCPIKLEDKCKRNCKGACMCQPGFFRNAIGDCISKDNCLKCQGKNEYFSCGGACDNVCRTLPYENQTHCPIINVKCNEKCYCEEGYARNDAGECVPFGDCELPCSPEEEYVRCASQCPTDTCVDSTKRKAACPPYPYPCKNQCVCKKGYYRNDKNKCVPYKQCPEPPSCPEGEIISKCPPEDPCPGEFCPSSRDAPQSCVAPFKCGPAQCVCAFNRLRDRQTGKCIPISQCPPFPCKGPNEEYQACPPPCPGQNCTDYLENKKCPKFRIGIVVPCRPQCRCKEGFYRDSNGICIKACDCGQPATSPPATSPPATDYPPTTVPPTTGQNNPVYELEEGNADFTSNFFAALMKDQLGTNLISSPFSVIFILALLALYSEGEGKQQLLSTLNLHSNDEIYSAIPALLNDVASQENIILTLASKIFMTDKYPLESKFVQDTENYFEAEAENLDFGNSKAAADTINKWVSDKTNNRITDLVSPSNLNDGTVVVIANAIYFLGNWVHQFNPKATKKRDFHVDKSTVVQKDTMYQKGQFYYGESNELDCKILELPYKGENMSLYIYLPNEVDGLSNLVESLKDSNTVDKALNSMSSSTVQVYLPKTVIKTTINLEVELKKVGINKIFDCNDSGLKGILKKDKPLCVSSAIQKAFIEINEIGTEAAAANGITVGGARPMPPSIESIFNVDHPCIFDITLQKMPLFRGALIN